MLLPSGHSAQSASADPRLCNGVEAGVVFSAVAMLRMVRPRSRCGATVVALAVAAAPVGTASAEWQIRRTQAQVQREGARAFATNPRSPEAAAKLLHSAGPTERVELIQRFGRRAADPSAGYEAIVAHGQLLLAANRWYEAAAAFARAIELEPDDWLPRWGAGRARQASGDPVGATPLLVEALDRAKRPVDIRRVATVLVDASLAARDGESEIRARRALVEVAPASDQQRLRWSLAQALGASGRSHEAAETLEDARQRQPELTAKQGAPWRIAEARFRMYAGDLTAADEAVAAVCAQTPRTEVELRREAWSLRIEIARQRGTTAALAAELSSPRDAVEWLAAARLREETGDFTSARRALARASELRPAEVELRRQEIQFVRRYGPRSDLVTLYEGLAAAAVGSRRVRDDPSALVDALDGLWQLRAEPKAGALFDRMLPRLAHAPRAMRALAESAARAGDDQRAMRAWSALLVAQPHDESAIVAVGEMHLARQARDQAVKTWRRIVHQGGGSIEARLRFAEVLADHDLVRDALKVLDEMVRRAPSDLRTLRSRALLHERLGQLALSEADWNAVLRITAGSHSSDERREAGAHLVNIWTRRGRHHLDRELESVEERARARPGDIETHTFLVDARLRTGQLDGAQTALRRLLDSELQLEARVAAQQRTDEAVIQAAYTVVTHLRQARRADEASRWLKEIARRWPQHARSAQLQLADIAVGLRQDATARRYIDEVAAAASREPNVLLRLGALEERLGDLRRAAALYRRAVEAGENSDATVALGAVLLRLGENDEARSLLRKALHDSTDASAAADAGMRLSPLDEAEGHLDRLAGDVAAAFVRKPRELPPAASAGRPRAREPAPSWAQTKPPGAYPPGWRELAMAVVDRSLSAPRPPRAVSPGDETRSGAAVFGLVGPLSFDLLPLATGNGDVPPSAKPEIALLGRAGYAPASGLLIRLLDALDRRGGLEPGRTSRTDRELAHAAIVALGQVGGADAQPTLARMSSRRVPSLRSAALWALGQIGSRTRLDTVGVRPLMQALEADDEQAALACLAIGRARLPEAGDRLSRIAMLAQHPTLVRRAAVTGLAAGKYVAHAPTLVQLLDGANEELAQAAATALVVLWNDTGFATISGDDLELLITHALALDGTESAAVQSYASFVLDGVGSGSQLGHDGEVIRSESWTAEDVLDALIAPVSRGAASGEWISRFHDRARALLLHRLASPDNSDRLRLLARLNAEVNALDETGAASPRAQGIRELVVDLKTEVTARIASGGPAERFAAVQLLATVAPELVSPVELVALIRRDERGGVAVARQIAKTAQQLPSDQLARLAVALTPSPEDGWNTRLAMIEALSWLPPSAVRDGALRAASADQSAFVRSAAAQALRSADQP